MENYKYLDFILTENPFSFKYDLEKTEKILNEEDISQHESDTIRFFNSCSKLFKNSHDKIIEVYKTFESKEQILDFLFENLNEQYVIAHKSILENSLSNNSFALNIEQIQFTKFENPNGPNINIKDALERGGDILNILIKFLNTFNDYIISPEKNSESKKSKDYFFDLWFHASNVYSFNSFYDIIRHEKGIIESSEEKTEIYSSDEFKEIRTLITVGEIRSRNHIHEFSAYLNFYKEAFGKKVLNRKKITQYNIKNGYIENLKTSIVKYSDQESINLAKHLKISKYLENLKFDYYGNISLKDIIEIISQIEQLVHLLSKNNISEETSEVGYKLNKRTLLNAIIDVTNIEEDTISKIINVIIERNESPYFWRKPLYEFNDNIYLSYSLLNAPNFDLLLESIIDEAKINISEQISSFKKEIINELSDISEKYTFKQIEIQNIDFENNLIYELQDYYLFIEIITLEKFPIETEDVNHSLLKLSIVADGIEDKISKLSKLIEVQKPFIPLILTNYTCFSGLILNKVPIFDETLLKNYFVTGNFKKGQTNFTSKQKTSKIYNQFNYYENEDEFNSHFYNFIINPVPIVEIQNKLLWKKVAVFPTGVKHQLYIDVCDYIDDNTNIENKIASLNSSLNHQYYNNIDERESSLYDVSVQFQLTDIFYLLAYGKYDFSFYRFQLSEIFQRVNVRGFSHLIFYFRNGLNNLSYLKPKKDKIFKPVKYEEETLDLIIIKILDLNPTVRLSDFNIGIELTKTEEKQLISYALTMISSINIKKYDQDNFKYQLLFLAILRNFSKKYGLYHEFYSACHNIISVLNFNNNFQSARNLTEEILLISIEDKKIYKGWEILFVCYEQQKNIFDASIYGCLYITSLTTETQLPYSEIINIFFNILKFSRNIYFTDILDSVFDFLKTQKLKEYDEQKIHLSYYLSILNNLIIKENKVEESLNYFNEKHRKIIHYKDKGIIPWLNYFYNVKRLQLEGYLNNILSVDVSIEMLEKEISEEFYLPMKQKHFSGEQLKSNFIESIRRSLNTNSYSDYIFENQNLDLDANHLINDGILKDEIDNILLSGFITNDIRLIYNNKYIEPETIVPFSTGESDYKYLNNYKEYVLSKIPLSKNQVILYLFTSKNNVYGLLINSEKNTKIIKINEWSLNTMDKWLKSTEKFYYDSKKYYDLSEQEESYNNLIKQLEFTNLDIDFEADEILISTNIDLSKFPLNLIVHKGDFLGAKKQISNILLLEWYLSNNKEVLINSNYTSTCWAPIEDGDPDINYGYEKLKPVLEKNNIKQLTESFPEEISSDLNIFFAHGELNGSGFKAIYKSDKNNSAVISNRRLFGSGKIAILFVCHSGTMDKNFFSNSVISLVHEIIELGYDAVIAPCWSLEVTIPEFWLNEFLIKFNSGFNINEAVFQANNELAVYKESISGSYYVPEGRLAMHLYGNPNIRIESVKEINI